MLPTCQSNGLYAKSQCHGTFCWCVDEMNGVMVNGTKEPGPIDCDLCEFILPIFLKFTAEIIYSRNND